MPLDTVSLSSLSSSLHFDGEILEGQREVLNDTASNVSVRSAVPSASSDATANREQNGEPGGWRELVEGSLSSQAIPPLALSPPSVSQNAHTRPWAGSGAHWTMRRLEQVRSASSMSGDSGNTRFTSQSLRQAANDYREGRRNEAQLENSLSVATEMGSAGPFRSSNSYVQDRSAPLSRSLIFCCSLAMNGETHPHAAVGLASLSSPQPLRRTAETEAFQLLDGVWSNSNIASVQGMSREMEFMERSLQERSVEVVPVGP